MALYDAGTTFSCASTMSALVVLQVVVLTGTVPVAVLPEPDGVPLAAPDVLPLPVVLPAVLPLVLPAAAPALPLLATIALPSDVVPAATAAAVPASDVPDVVATGARAIPPPPPPPPPPQPTNAKVAINGNIVFCTTFKTTYPLLTTAVFTCSWHVGANVLSNVFRGVLQCNKSPLQMNGGVFGQFVGAGFSG
ncbi:hypothetical protein WKW79_21825 [Variovorax robiniae]|uniref:Uncharacterized protein n=1 Tax=Variovorax robiniae TaxID=1836199 RepID=A0ABU8XBK8_9BURK